MDNNLIELGRRLAIMENALDEINNALIMTQKNVRIEISKIIDKTMKALKNETPAP